MKKNYIIIEVNNTTELEVSINQKIKEGYEPVGGISFCGLDSSGSDYYVVQAMILNSAHRGKK